MLTYNTIKKYFLFILTFLVSFFYSQNPPKEYSDQIRKAEHYYKIGDYEKSAFAYSAAFKSFGWKGRFDDRYNAACSWALSKKPDSAFFNINRISSAFYFIGKRIMEDPDLRSLHSDNRWGKITTKIKHVLDSVEAYYNMPLKKELDSIFINDQKYRLLFDEIDKTPLKSEEWKKKQKDSAGYMSSKMDGINIRKVTAILDKYGWLGPDEVGPEGSSALFLVIQHSDRTTQEKYLPMMREAVKNKKASPADLALLEDRINLAQGKEQIYGSQLESKDGINYYLPSLADPDNVDKRRAKVGLEPLKDYLANWDIVWDVEQYKKDQIENKEWIKQRKEGREAKYAHLDSKIFYLWTAIILFGVVGLALILKRK